MRAVFQQVAGAGSAGEQKRDRREISLGRVAGLACQNEIVAPIIGCLAASRGYMIERHQDRRITLSTVGADGSVLLE